MFGGLIMRMARAALEGILSQLTQQQNIVAEMALRPMNMMVQQVIGGVWIGKGADRFVQEVQQAMIPGVTVCQTQIGTMSRNIMFARERITRADVDVARLIKGSIFDSFKFF